MEEREGKGGEKKLKKMINFLLVSQLSLLLEKVHQAQNKIALAKKNVFSHGLQVNFEFVFGVQDFEEPVGEESKEGRLLGVLHKI